MSKPSVEEWIASNIVKGGVTDRDLLRKKIAAECRGPTGPRTVSNVLKDRFPEVSLTQSGTGSKKRKGTHRDYMYYGISICQVEQLSKVGRIKTGNR